MAQINLVTGYTGEAHIKSEDDAVLNTLLAGQANALINLDYTFNDTDCDISCDALVWGRMMRTDGAVNLTFTKPSSGYYRFDGIYLVYKKSTSGIESAELVYCEGEQNATESIAEQNIGMPTVDSSVADSSWIQILVVQWSNTQTKTVVQGIQEDGVAIHKEHTTETGMPENAQLFKKIDTYTVLRSGWAFVVLILTTKDASAGDNFPAGISYTIPLNLPHAITRPHVTIPFPREGSNMPLVFMTASITQNGEVIISNRDLTTSLSNNRGGLFSFAYPYTLN